MWENPGYMKSGPFGTRGHQDFPVFLVHHTHNTGHLFVCFVCLYLLGCRLQCQSEDHCLSEWDFDSPTPRHLLILLVLGVSCVVVQVLYLCAAALVVYKLSGPEETKMYYTTYKRRDEQQMSQLLL